MAWEIAKGILIAVAILAVLPFVVLGIHRAGLSLWRSKSLRAAPSRGKTWLRANPKRLFRFFVWGAVTLALLAGIGWWGFKRYEMAEWGLMRESRIARGWLTIDEQNRELDWCIQFSYDHTGKFTVCMDQLEVMAHRPRPASSKERQEIRDDLERQLNVLERKRINSHRSNRGIHPHEKN